jgi:predicted transglutaminase-like cysteine proteinase
MLRSVAIAAAVLTATLQSAAASAAKKPAALPPLVTAMHALAPARAPAPAAFADFCRRTPQECAADPVSGGRAELTPALWAELKDVNDTVNRSMVAKTDMEIYGVVDYWTLATSRGDCEDFALTKQKILRERGWPMSALLMTVVRDENGEGHAVLTVRTSRGDLVLDNRQPRIVAWSDEPYTFIKRQSVRNPREWMALQPNLPRPGDPVASALQRSIR